MGRKSGNSAEILSNFKNIGYLICSVNLIYDSALTYYLFSVAKSIEEYKKVHHKAVLWFIIQNPFNASIICFVFCAIFDIVALWGLYKVSMNSRKLTLLNRQPMCHVKHFIQKTT
jgi:hypothetical protein